MIANINKRNLYHALYQAQSCNEIIIFSITLTNAYAPPQHFFHPTKNNVDANHVEVVIITLLRSIIGTVHMDSKLLASLYHRIFPLEVQQIQYPYVQLKQQECLHAQ